MSNRKHTADPYRQTVVLGAVSLLIGTMVSVLGFLLLGKLVVRSAMTLEDAILPVTLLGTAGAFAAGFCMVKLIQKNSLVCGFVSGGYFTLIFSAAALWNGLGNVTWYTPLKIACFLLGGTLGGAVAAMKRTRARHKR